MNATSWIDDLEVKARAALEATPGEWHAGDGWVYTLPVDADDGRLANVLGMEFTNPDRMAIERDRAQRNVNHIAAANPAAVLRLIRELQETRASLATMEHFAEVAQRTEARSNAIAQEAATAHNDLVMLAAELGWATDGRLATAVHHVKELLRRRDSTIAAVKALADEWEDDHRTDPALRGTGVAQLRSVIDAADTGGTSTRTTEGTPNG